MTVANDMSLFTLISGASLPVQAVMAILLITSLFSWWYIFIKVATIKRAETESEEFENKFWSGGDLNKLYEAVTAGRRKPQGMASIFEAGFKEFVRHKQQPGMEAKMDVSDVMEGSRRAMRAAYNRELDDLDAHLPFLASVGSVSPYIGLFGTVWGIMNSFRGLSNVAQATLSRAAWIGFQCATRVLWKSLPTFFSANHNLK
jgi:biopolymer transport protein TolQ